MRSSSDATSRTPLHQIVSLHIRSLHSFRFIIPHLVDTIPLLQWQSSLLSPFALSLCEQARVRPLLAPQHTKIKKKHSNNSKDSFERHLLDSNATRGGE